MSNEKRESPATPGTFLLIDGSSLLFRAFYAIRNLSTRDGIMTNGVYGFLNMFFKAKEEWQPDRIVVAFDRSTPTFRVADYEAYKANRPPTPSDLVAQFGILKDVLDAMKICHLDLDGYEADDILGTLAAQSGAEGWNNYLLTGDRDYFQLVDANTKVLYTVKGIREMEVVDEAWIEQKYGLRPPQLIDVKALQGDSSDNIPGVPGIGEKTACKLIQQFGDLDGVYAHLDEVSGKKLKENLETYRTQAYLSRKLGTIFRSVPLEIESDRFAVGTPDLEALRDRLERLEFQSFLSRFPTEEGPALSESPSIAWAEEAQWDALAAACRDAGEMVLAVLGDGENYIHATPCFFAWKAGARVWILDVRGKESAFAQAFRAVLEDPNFPKRGYDTKASMYLLRTLGIRAAGCMDVMLMEYLLDPNRSRYEISGLAQRVLNRRVPSEEEVLGKGVKRREFPDIEKEALEGYVAGLLSVCEAAAPKLLEELDELGMRRLYEEVENPLAEVLCRMEWRGIAADRQKLDELDVDFSKRLQTLEETIYREAGQRFNINSPKQLGELLFEKMNLPHGKKTKTGYSTSVDVLEKLRDVPIVDAVLQYRQLAKLKSTYVDGLRACIDADGRIRSTFRQQAAATGRISSTEPNLQNIPVRTEDGRKLRAVFQAGEGCLLVDADYSQIELRVLASLAGDVRMIEAFAQGEDIHRKTAAEVNHIPQEEVTPLERSRAKAINFGIIYGISGYGLSQDLGISRKEAEEYIERYKNTYPQIRDYMENIVRQGKQDGYVSTAYGRRRRIPELQSKNFSIRSFGERIALNTPIQGTAADIIKIAMVRVDRALKAHALQARLLLQIHDELIVEAPEEEAEEVGQLLVEIMEGVGQFAVALRADMKIAKSWYDAK